MKVWTEATGEGQKTLFIEQNGKRQLLYSRHAPRGDGLRFFRRNHEEGCDFYIFIGMGLGYQIEPFIHEPGVRRIIILEPVKELFTAVKGEETVRRLLANPKVEVHTGETTGTFTGDMKSHYEWLFYRKIRVLCYQPLRRVFEPRYSALEIQIKKELGRLAGDGLTIARFSGIWLKNFLINVRTSSQVKLVSSLYNCVSGSVVITGAGPSLDHAITQIKKKRGGFFLIATDASFKPLIRNGIIPDMLFSIDPASLVYSHFMGLDRGVFRSIPAVLSFLSFPRVFELFKNRYIFFTLHPLSNFFSSEFLKETTIPHVQSVASLALKVALRMGFEQILLAGFDFSYPGMRVYAKDTFFMDYGLARAFRFIPFCTIEAQAIRRGSQKVEGEDGYLLYTSQNLVDYLNEIEAITKESETTKILQFGGGVELKSALKVTAFPDGRGYRRLGERIIQMPIKDVKIEDSDIIHPLLTTLALRYRMYKDVTEVDMAYQKARGYLQRILNKNHGGIKFEMYDSDI